MFIWDLYKFNYTYCDRKLFLLKYFTKNIFHVTYHTKLIKFYLKQLYEYVGSHE